MLGYITARLAHLYALNYSLLFSWGEQAFRLSCANERCFGTNSVRFRSEQKQLSK